MFIPGFIPPVRFGPGETDPPEISISPVTYILFDSFAGFVILNKQSTLQWYSVTQSHANNFLGDVVLESVNNVSRDEDNISDFYYGDLKF